MTDVAPDGSPVAFYRRLPAAGEPELVTPSSVNDPEDGAAFVKTAAAHLEPEGVLVGETYSPGSDPSASVGRETRLGDAHVETPWARVVGDLLEAEVRYGVDDLVWQQVFRARLLDEGRLQQLLADSGLSFDRWLDRPGWFVADVRR